MGVLTGNFLLYPGVLIWEWQWFDSECLFSHLWYSEINKSFHCSYFYITMPMRLPRETPGNSRQVWVWLGMHGHIQSKVVVVSNCILGPFWAFFGEFNRKEEFFWKISFSHCLPFLDFYCCVKFQKKIYRQKNGQTDRLMDWENESQCYNTKSKARDIQMVLQSKVFICKIIKPKGHQRVELQVF